MTRVSEVVLDSSALLALLQSESGSGDGNKRSPAPCLPRWTTAKRWRGSAKVGSRPRTSYCHRGDGRDPGRLRSWSGERSRRSEVLTKKAGLSLGIEPGPHPQVAGDDRRPSVGQDRGARGHPHSREGLL